MAFNAVTKYPHWHMPFSNRDKAVNKNLYHFKNTVCRKYWQNFWKQTAKEKDWAFYYKHLRNAKHRLKAWSCRPKRTHIWKERDHRGWTARPSKSCGPETSVSFNTPDTQRAGSNTV